MHLGLQCGTHRLRLGMIWIDDQDGSGQIQSILRALLLESLTSEFSESGHFFTCRFAGIEICNRINGFFLRHRRHSQFV